MLERGTRGITFVLDFMLFTIFPTIIEILLVAAILWGMFDLSFAAVTLATIGVYIAFTLLFTDWRLRFRREMNATDQDANTKAIDSLLNYETVKYFSNEAHEERRYDASLSRYERAYTRSETTLNLLNAGQAAIIAVGLTLVMSLAAQGVAAGRMTVGDFVLVNTYLIQLYMPLNFLGFAYREIKQGLTDMEEMFRLMREPQEVEDAPDAAQLRAGPGELVFDDVRFGYRPDREILKGVSFRVPPGRTLAIVGPTGAGKSTISRLLFRFYDATGGAVRVDGQDIRDVTQSSPAGGDRRGAAGHGAVQRHHPLQHRLRPAGRDRRGGGRGGEARAGPRLRGAAARGLPHHGRRARAQALRRREAAGGDRAHHPQGPAHPHPGRGDQRRSTRGRKGRSRRR